jgi:TolB-like protein/DNA-binding winged helix-turn-helix (wHTH) protein/Flp pilus assembly protein TadD
VALGAARTGGVFRFGEDFVLDPASGGLRRSDRAVRLERIPAEILLLLVKSRGELVSRDEIVEAVWGKGIFLDTDNSINGAIRKIRQALRDDSEEPQFVQTISGKGYRFIAPVVESGASAADIAAIPNAPARIVPGSETGERSAGGKSSRWYRRLLASAVVMAVVAAGIYWLNRRGHTVDPTAAARPMLAVLPFENFTGDASQDYFSDGLTEEMISQLGNLDPVHLGVIARTSVMHYKHSQESIPQIGKDLGVQYVIEGSVRRDSERVRITAQLIEVKDQSPLWARQYDRDLGHLLELQEEIAHEVANEIEFSLSGRWSIEAAGPTAAPGTEAKSYEAYDLYLKGLYFWNKRTGEGFRQAADYFQQAIDKDATYGRAYAGLADTFGVMSAWFVGPQNELMPKARAAALRALELDQNLAEAHASLALIKENYDYDWRGAENEFRRAIELNPQYATAHQWYAEFLSWQGRFDEAFAESERARQLDPLSLIIASDHASILYYSRQYDSAVKQCRSVLEQDPNYDHARAIMIRSLVQLGRYDEAVDQVNRSPAHEENPWMWAWKATIYSRSGHREEAQQALAKVEQFSDSGPARASIWLIAYPGADQKDRAIELLQKAYAEHSNVVTPIKVDPTYDSIRSDPRFEDLLRRIGLGH